MGDKLIGKVNMLRKLVGMYGIDVIRPQFLQEQEKQMKKYIKKKKFDKIDKEKNDWLSSPSFMKFWKETFGFTEAMIDQMFKYEVPSES